MMRKNLPILINAILVLSLAILACGGVTITVNESGTATPAPQIIPSEGSTPSQNSISTEVPAPSTGTNYDLYAEFPKNKPISFLVLHKSGEKLGSVQNMYSAYPSSVVSVLAGGETVTIFADRDSGLPQSAVFGDTVVFYSNYTDTTVDLQLVHADGSRESLRVKRDTQILQQISAISFPTLGSMGMPVPVSFHPQAADIFVGSLKAALYVKSAGACFIGVSAAVASGGIAIPALIPLADDCRSFILDTAISVGKLANLNVANLEKVNTSLDFLGCTTIIKEDCLDTTVDIMDKTLELAKNKELHVPIVYAPAPGTPKPGKYP